MVKRGWKIVTRPFAKGYYWSGYEPKTRARYYVGARTYPHLGSGPLAVFASRDDAEQFRASVVEARLRTILPCTYDEIDTRFWAGTDPALYRGTRSCLGGPDFCACDFMLLAEVPKGTRLARWVKLEDPIK